MYEAFKAIINTHTDTTENDGNADTNLQPILEDSYFKLNRMLKVRWTIFAILICFIGKTVDIRSNVTGSSPLPFILNSINSLFYSVNNISTRALYSQLHICT